MILSGGSGGGGGAGGGKVTNGLRLTLTTATPVATADVTGATTIYLTPYISDEIALYDGVATWTVRSTAEVSLALGTLVSGKNYDVFAYYDTNALAVKLELSAAWTNDTTRADAVARQNGILSKTSDKTRRLVGTIRTTSTTATEDSATNRFVWNASNQVSRPPCVILTTDQSTTSSAYATLLTIGVVCGDIAAIEAKVTMSIQKTTTGNVRERIAVDTVALDLVGVSISNGLDGPASVVGAKTLAAGYHAVTLDWSTNAGTALVRAQTQGTDENAQLTAAWAA